MNVFDLFKKSGKSRQPSHIDFHDDCMDIDGHVLKFPLALSELVSLLGEPEKRECVSFGVAETRYIFHDAGLVFRTCDPQFIFLKSRKVFRDETHNIVGCDLYGGKKVTPVWREDTLPVSICTAALTFNGKPVFFWSDGRASTENFKAVYWDNEQENRFNEKGIPNGTISISFDPPRPKSGGTYKIKPCKEETLVFDNFNFKLAVLQVLIYDLEVIKPYFDIYEFAEQYNGKEIDTESETPIHQALNYFQKLPVPISLADRVEEIYMDGGNNIYMNIAPQWDGEDGIFDIDTITEKEITQFPNLKKITLMSSNFDEVSKVFQLAEIECKSL